MEKVIDLTLDTLVYLEQVPQRPNYVKSSEPAPTRTGGTGPRLGIRPSYSDEKDGVLLDGVSEGTPAEKCGLKGGDRIVEMDSKPIKNLSSYMAIMSGHKKGDNMDIVVERGGKRLTVRAKLE
jgi:S1-C subfamily serine protease